MKAPMLHPSRQAFAQGCARGGDAIAPGTVARHDCLADHWQFARGVRRHSCYPSPSLRPGPSQAGPTLGGQSSADCATRPRNCFESSAVAVKSAAITTTERGSSSCASRSSFSLFCPCRFPAACRIPRRAGWLVPPQARWSPMRWTKTSSPVPRWAALPVLLLAASNWACRPAARLTDLTAFRRVQTFTRAIRAERRGGPLPFVPQGGADV